MAAKMAAGIPENATFFPILPIGSCNTSKMTNFGVENSFMTSFWVLVGPICLKYKMADRMAPGVVKHTYFALYGLPGHVVTLK